MGQSLRIVAVLTLGLVVSCASSPDPVSDDGSAAPERSLPKTVEIPWTLDEASAAVCQGKEGCEITEIWDEQSTGRAGLYVMALGLSPENASDTCPLSEYVRVDLQARDATLLARTCPEGDFENEVKIVPGQLTQQRTGGSMFNVTHKTFAYDLHRARPVETYQHEILAGTGIDRRQGWRFGALKGQIHYDLVCNGTLVEAQETAFVDATLDSAADAATMASWDWGACSSPIDGQNSRL